MNEQQAQLLLLRYAKANRQRQLDDMLTEARSRTKQDFDTTSSAVNTDEIERLNPPLNPNEDIAHDSAEGGDTTFLRSTTNEAPNSTHEVSTESDSSPNAPQPKEPAKAGLLERIFAIPNSLGLTDMMYKRSEQLDKYMQDKSYGKMALSGLLGMYGLAGAETGDLGNTQIANYVKGIGKGVNTMVMGNRSDFKTTSDFLKKANMLQGNNFPEKAANFGISMAGDIATNPLTYLDPIEKLADPEKLQGTLSKIGLTNPPIADAVANRDLSEISKVSGQVGGQEIQEMVNSLVKRSPKTSVLNLNILGNSAPITNNNTVAQVVKTLQNPIGQAVRGVGYGLSNNPVTGKTVGKIKGALGPIFDPNYSKSAENIESGIAQDLQERQRTFYENRGGAVGLFNTRLLNQAKDAFKTPEESLKANLLAEKQVLSKEAMFNSDDFFRQRAQLGLKQIDKILSGDPAGMELSPYYNQITKLPETVIDEDVVKNLMGEILTGIDKSKTTGEVGSRNGLLAGLPREQVAFPLENIMGKAGKYQRHVKDAEGNDIGTLMDALSKKDSWVKAHPGMPMPWQEADKWYLNNHKQAPYYTFTKGPFGSSLLNSMAQGNYTSENVALSAADAASGMRSFPGNKDPLITNKGDFITMTDIDSNGKEFQRPVNFGEGTANEMLDKTYWPTGEYRTPPEYEAPNTVQKVIDLLTFKSLRDKIGRKSGIPQVVEAAGDIPAEPPKIATEGAMDLYKLIGENKDLPIQKVPDVLRKTTQQVKALTMLESGMAPDAVADMVGGEPLYDLQTALDTGVIDYVPKLTQKYGTRYNSMVPAGVPTTAFTPSEKVVGALDKINIAHTGREKMQEFARLAQMNAEIEKHGNPAEAGRRVMDIFSPRKSLTKIEKQTLGWLSPGYSNVKSNTMEIMDLMNKNPNFVRASANMQPQLAKLDPDLQAQMPKYLQQAGPTFGYRKHPDDYYAKVWGRSPDPLSNFQRTWAGGPEETVRYMLGSMNPWVKIPAQVATGQDFYTGRPYSEAHNAYLYRNAPSEIKDIMGYHIDETGHEHINETLRAQLLAIAPTRMLINQIEHGKEVGRAEMYLRPRAGLKPYKIYLKPEQNGTPSD